MVDKPNTAEQYKSEVTGACEIALGLLHEAFGGFKDSLRLIGGLVPRYLVPNGPGHVGTNDVDIVLDVQILLAGEDYKSLRSQLKEAGFTRKINDGIASSWQWELKINEIPITVEFLVHGNDTNDRGVISLNNEDISACKIPYAGMSEHWFEAHTLHFERPGGDGVSIETIRHTDATAFLALKALAIKYRNERKDIADLIYVLEHYEGAPDSIAKQYAERLNEGTYSEPLEIALATLEEKFCTDEHIEGYKKDGPGRYVNFHSIQGENKSTIERRRVSRMVTEFIKLVRAQ